MSLPVTTGVIILAAGKGQRMRSNLPKVLHPLAKRPLLAHVFDAVSLLSEVQVLSIVYGDQGERIQRALHQNIEDATQEVLAKKERKELIWIQQSKALGTAHAVQEALFSATSLHAMSRVLILCGDTPLISTESLAHFLESVPEKSVGVMTASLPDPTGYGRIVRNAEQKIIAIIEEKEATFEERCLCEVNSGIYLMPVQPLISWLAKISNQNCTGEYYLTDVIAQAVADGVSVYPCAPKCIEEIYGANTHEQLACLERFYQRIQVKRLLDQGALLLDSEHVYVRGTVSVGRDVCIDANVIMEGHVHIADECMIGPNTVLKNVCLQDNVVLKGHSVLENVTIDRDTIVGPFSELSDMKIGVRVRIPGHSVLKQSEIGAECIVGPFTHLRPKTVLLGQAAIGNFVEIKNSCIAERTKINHLSYIGDSIVGCDVNIGAGTITCNFDGVNKHLTRIEDHVFIGSNSALIAPVVIGNNAVIGAGSVITADAPPDQLTLSRVPQKSVKRKKKNGKEKQKE